MNDQAADRLFESAFYKAACRMYRTAGGEVEPEVTNALLMSTIADLKRDAATLADDERTIRNRAAGQAAELRRFLYEGYCMSETAHGKRWTMTELMAGSAADPADWMKHTELGRCVAAALAEVRAGNARPDKLREIQRRDVNGPDKDTGRRKKAAD